MTGPGAGWVGRWIAVAALTGAVVLPCAAEAQTTGGDAESGSVEDVVVPGPPGAGPATPVATPLPPPTLPPSPPLAPARRGSSALPGAVPFMLGFGVTVLGGVGLTSTIAFMASSDLSGIDGEGGTALALALTFSAILAGVGLYLTIGALAGEVEIHTWYPGWSWIAAIASLLGGISTIAAVATYLVDEHFGDDSIGFTVGAGVSYLLTLLVLVGLDGDGGGGFAVTPGPMPGGAGVWALGRF